jgi:hypothetical protein
MEVHVNSVITFLYLTDKPGEVHPGRDSGKYMVKELDANIPERWG